MFCQQCSNGCHCPLFFGNDSETNAMPCRYGVPGSGARRFEEVMRMTAPQRFQEDRDLLHHLTTLTPPPLLMHNGECAILRWTVWVP